MMIVMKPGATQAQLDHVLEHIHANSLTPHLSVGEDHTVIGAVGDTHAIAIELFEVLDGVAAVKRISQPFKLASRTLQPFDSVFPINGLSVGGEEILLVAGPCSVESRSQLLETAQAVKEAGANALRGGIFKPRTSPYSFQGLGEQGLELIAEARALTGLPLVVEITSINQVEVLSKNVDVLQVGARNMQNFALLSEVGRTQMPVLLKRGMSATIEELLMAAEYILAGGNPRVILCERGIRTFETATRNTTDINAVPVLKSLTHLPVLLDPSHSTGHWEYVGAVARAAVAAGADGLIVEVHPDPEHALSDGRQSLRPEKFAELVRQVGQIAGVMGRKLTPVTKL
ncbi:MAG: 3-deoxy-7-phosphoheptulonate synthase [Anaerolineales bacterium]|nr:3-deoxy-7-phosphoheptulonate synthase [Anaerolineales bacterium]